MTKIFAIVLGAPVGVYWSWVKMQDRGPRRKPGTPPYDGRPIDPLLASRWESHA